MIIKIKQHWNDAAIEVSVRKTEYKTGHTCLELIEADGSRYAVATVNLPEKKLPANMVALKGWSENEGIPDALEAAGVVKRTGRIFECGFAAAEEAALLI